MGRNFKIVILVLVALLLAASLNAQYLIKDRAGKVVPYLGTRFETGTVACSADTVWTKVALPPGTYEITCMPTAGLAIAADSLYTKVKKEIALADTTAYLTLPVHNMNMIWIRRSAAGTAASLKLIFRKW